MALIRVLLQIRYYVGLKRPLLLNWMPIFESYMTMFVVKNVLHQVDMCYNEIGLRANQCTFIVKDF